MAAPGPELAAPLADTYDINNLSREIASDSSTHLFLERSAIGAQINNAWGVEDFGEGATGHEGHRRFDCHVCRWNGRLPPCDGWPYAASDAP